MGNYGEDDAGGEDIGVKMKVNGSGDDYDDDHDCSRYSPHDLTLNVLQGVVRNRVLNKTPKPQPYVSLGSREPCALNSRTLEPANVVFKTNSRTRKNTRAALNPNPKLYVRVPELW